MSSRKFSFFLAISLLIHGSYIFFSMKAPGRRQIFLQGDGHPLSAKMISQVVKSKAISKTRIKAPQAEAVQSQEGYSENAEKGVEPGTGVNEGGTVHLPVSYPEVSRLRGEEGVVKLRVAINQLGRVEDVTVLKSSGFQRLDLEAVRAARSLEGAEQGARDYSVQFKLDDL